MIAKEVNYDLALEEWQALLDTPGVGKEQRKTARYCLAGLQAEKDMAYYLNVQFADSEDFWVFNNLKVAHNGLTAQMDHLVLTRWTAYFIESKSVSQIITVNEHGEWGRIHNRRFTPIESPLEQSKRHERLLYDYLTANRDEFMGKLLGLKRKYFHHHLTPVHYVAISPRGQIRGNGRSRFEELMKADQIASTIYDYHDALNRNILTGRQNGLDMPAFRRDELDRLLAFLLANDRAETPTEQAHAFIAELESKARQLDRDERTASDDELSDATPTNDPGEYFCRSCEAKSLSVAHGPYGYYFKCAACDGNTPIDEACPECGNKMKVTKSGSQFSLTCPKCGGLTPFWTNPPASDPTAAANTEPPATEAKDENDAQVCPRCGSQMELRKARRGKNAGEPFWGCVNYPKCRGIVQA